MLRLVVEDEVRDDTGDNTTVKPFHREVPMRAVAEAVRKPRAKRKGMPEAEDQAAIEQNDAADGPIEESAAQETADESSQATADLGVLEALLFSTHHPLTAGKLAELLEL